MLAFLGLRWRQHCQLLSLAVFLQNTFWKGINKKKKGRLPSVPNHNLSKIFCLQMIPYYFTRSRSLKQTLPYEYA